LQLKKIIHRKTKTKWVTFTYSGKETRKMTMLFRDTELKVAFCTPNTIQNIFRPQPQINNCNKNAIYQMKCMDCPMEYVGQTGRTFNTRYKEHICDIRSNNSSIRYSSHILNTGHTCCTVEDTMKIIKIGRKRQYLNTLEKYCFYKVSRENLHMNDTSIDTQPHIQGTTQNIQPLPHPHPQHSHET
jgi:hypothetical protein